MRSALIALSLSLALAAPAAADSRTARSRSKRSEKWTKKRDRVAGGLHWRVSTPRGIIHVWVPPGYRRKTAGLVVYLHGDGVNADGAWTQHHLAKQFRASRQNAMFVVPEAPNDTDKPVIWPELGKFRRALRRKGGFIVPRGHQVVIGHSRAYATMGGWLDNKYLHQVIVLDGFYGSVQQRFNEFLTGKRARQHRVLIVAKDTYARAAAFARRFKWAQIRSKKGVPTRLRQLTRRQRRSRLLVIRSQFGHSAIVKSGKVIPLVLQVTPLRRIK
jgi:hypothetical protein